jgi:MFS transporter (putative signal transducer)
MGTLGARQEREAGGLEERRHDLPPPPPNAVPCAPPMAAAGVDLRKIGLLGVVYVAQGMAPGFAAFAMPVLLRRSGVSLQGVGLAGLLLLPVALKFVFGPWADRVAASGETRRWIGGLQAALAACVAALALVPPERALVPFLTLVGLAYLVVAVADVLTDGVAVRVLARVERPLGNGAQYGGYYLGSIVAGGVFLAVEPRLGWVPSVAMLAALVASGLAAGLALTRRLPGSAEPAAGAPARASLLATLRGPLGRNVLPLLLLLDLPQNVGIALVGPFLLDLGLTQAQVGLVSGTGGLVAAVAGAALGGALLTRLSRPLSLFAAGTLQIVPLLGFAWLAGRPASVSAALAVVSAAYFTASAFNVALSAWFMDHVSRRQPATDYSVLACAHTGTFVVGGPIAGGAAAALGFRGYFLAAGIVGALLLLAAMPWVRRFERRHGKGSSEGITPGGARP